VTELVLIALLAAGAIAVRKLAFAPATDERAAWERAARLLRATLLRDGDLRYRLGAVDVDIRLLTETIHTRTTRRTMLSAMPLPGDVSLRVEPRSIVGRPIHRDEDPFAARFDVVAKPESLGALVVDKRLRNAILEYRDGARA
jgi:hypothetical protein